MFTLASKVAATVLLAFIALSLDRARPIPPRRIFASANGRFGCHVVCRLNRMDALATGELYTFDVDGKEKQVWKVDWTFVPVRLVISDEGKVVTLNAWGCEGYAHTLVAYGADGRILKDYTLDSLLSPQEIREHVDTTFSNRFWNNESKLWFSKNPAGRERLVIQLSWGKQIEVDLETGELMSR